MDESMAYARSEPGTGPTPVYEPIEEDQKNHWRRDTPPLPVWSEEDED